MELLIKTTAHLRACVSYSGDLEYTTLKPAIRSAQQLVARYVGDELLEELAGDQLTDQQATLLEYVLVPIANLTLLGFVGVGNVKISDSGVLRTKSSTENDAFEWQVEGTKTALRQQAFDGIEDLLRYLDRHKADFTTYTASEVYQADLQRLIRTAGLFNLYYEIGSSRLVFQTLSAALRTAEKTIRPMLGSQLPDLLGDTLTAEQQELLDAARRALVYLTLARAVREKLVLISDAGVQVAGISQFASLNYKQPASDRQLDRSLAYFDEQAADFVSALKTLLTPPTSTTTNTGPRVSGTAIVAF